jgi:hypothetical protein
MHLKRSIGAAALALAASFNVPAAWGIIVHDANGLTTAPSDGGGFSFVGQWGNGVGSGVAIAPQWLLTAQHFTNASNQFILNGVTYTRDQALVDIAGTDLRLVHVSGTFPAWAPLYRSGIGESGKVVSLVGFGYHQHAANPDVVTGPTQNGYLWAGDAVTRSRGKNKVSTTRTVNGYPALFYDFDKSTDPSAVTDEGALADHDSGGGAFIFEDGEWKLAGIHLGFQAFYQTANAADFIHGSIFESTGLFQSGTPPRPPATGGAGLSFSSRVAPYLSQIDAVTSNTAASTRYWDINGTTAGPGGTAPGGNWDGTTTNFNTDSTGGSGGVISAIPQSVDNVVFSAGNTATGSYTINVTAARTVGSVKVEEGTVTFSGVGSIAANSYDVSSGAIAKITTTVNGGITKTGTGKLQLPKIPQSSAVTINAGTLEVLESAPGLSSGHPSGNNAFVSRPASVSISNNAAPLGSRVYTGTLDLQNNDLIIDYTGGSPIADIEDMVRSGYNGDLRNGTGIMSSVAVANGNYILAVADNAQLVSPFGSAQGGPNFSGVNVDLTSVLVKFTYRVDLNLDGLVTDADAIVFSTNFENGAAANWAMGDLNFDRQFTDADAIIFSTYYETGGASLPEPVSAGVLGLVGLLAIRRTRPRS